MNFIRYLIVAPLGWAAVLPSAAAVFSGSDDFNDNNKDPALWGSDIIHGNGALDEINSRLEYTGGGAGISDSNRPWIQNYAGFGSSWELRLDVSNSHIAAAGEVSSFGIELFERGDVNDSVYVELYSVETKKGFYSVLRANGDEFAAEADTGNLNSTFGTVQISYDGGTKVMTTSYDADGPANGFSWVQLGSFGINGSGGTTGNANWGMNDSSEFSANVYGYSENVTMTSGMMQGDNFVAVPEPTAWAILPLVAGGIVFRRRRRRTHWGANN